MSQIDPSAARGSGSESRFHRATNLLWRLAKIFSASFVLVVLLMMFLENALIFPAPRYPEGNWDHGLEDVYFTSTDGTQLHGVLIEHPDPKVFIMFCHGNGEHVAYNSDLVRHYHQEMNATVFAFDYRGYGRSEGRPHEAGVLKDGHAAQHWFAERAGIQPDQIILIGRSLGGAVAVELAVENGAKALVLERTFTSMPDVAARLYPLLPIRLLMRTQFNSMAKIGEFQGPLLQSHGTRDSLVPHELGRRLFDAATSTQKEFYDEVGVGHNDAYSDGYCSKLKEFIGRLSRDAASSNR